ncbi:Male sterility NAD-binding [Penicillium verhagenii]|uniref:Male sterility NAD-binding n=1 Tax=Penicillium verhagenii TaxID=1562060 RepID=UPI00254548EF|nr:Male sterility NAD-binding [Penicillium verhagenii]KAJ5918435.1 Male sterility NAD-binding [Penicillium verhagenii]
MSYEQYQAVFHNFPDVEEWSTKDVFRKHPSIDELWEYRYRIDDLVVFSTGEKMNPMPVESRLNGIPGVKAALVFGGNRLYPGLLVEMDDGTQIGISLDTVPDDLQRSIKDALKIENSQNSRDSEIHEKMIIFAPTDKPFVRTPKGTVHRNQTLQLYESDIDKIYHSVDISESSDWEPLCLDLSDEKALAASLATFIGKSLLSSTALMAHMDVFAAGLDSKKAQILAISLERALGDRGCRASEDKLTININAIYQNPTPAMLASFIFRDLESLEDGPGEENGFDQILTR